ncbi:MAG: PorT family protein [Hymenobacteraceae bacterium]|nr:PorT family protein [Hymenobacteraceae bacterium]
MKNLLLPIALVLGLTATAQAQVEIGLKLSPGFSSNRFTESKTVTLANDGARLHLGGGLVVDYFFGENYAFNTGLELVSKGGNVKSASVTTDAATGLPIPTSATLKLGAQYVQAPVGIKLFTNEIAPDTRLYFLLGGEVGVLAGARSDGSKTFKGSFHKDEKVTKYINTFEAGVQVGAGAELLMGKSTKVFGGFSYHRGLTNIADKSLYGDKDVAVQNNLFALDIGLKF